MFENLFGGGKKPQTNAPAIKPAIQPAVGMGTPAITPQAPAGQTTGGKDAAVVVEDLQKEVEKLKDSVNAIRGTLKSITEKMDALEQNMSQLASVYELLTNQTNPFLDEDERKAVAPKPKAETPVAIPAPAPAKEEDVVLPEIDQTNPKVIQTVIDWMEFLVERVGHQGIPAVLQYYTDIHWISEDVAEILKRYADGIRVENEPAVEENPQLDPEDHMKSLDYILQIKDLQQG